MFDEKAVNPIWGILRNLPYDSAVVSVLIAALVAWLIQVNKKRKKIQRLHILLLSEITQHQVHLCHLVDAFLPDWLRRNERKLIFVRNYKVNLETEYFDKFLKDLEESSIFIPIVSYYKEAKS